VSDFHNPSRRRLAAGGGSISSLRTFSLNRRRIPLHEHRDEPRLPFAPHVCATTARAKVKSTIVCTYPSGLRDDRDGRDH